MKYKIETINNIDKVSLNFAPTTINKYPIAIACKCNGHHYQLTDFLYDKNEYLLVELNSTIDMINLATSLYDNLSIFSLSNIAVAVVKFDLNYKEINIFKIRKVLNDKLFNAIKAVGSYKPNIKKYLNEKELPFKSLEFLTLLSSHQQQFLDDYISVNNYPSQQSVKIFIEQLILNKEFIIEKIYTKDFKFDDMRTDIHKEIDDNLLWINKLISPAKLSTADNYESGKIIISGILDRADTFDNFIKKISDNQDEINKFIEKLKLNDLYK